MKYHKIFLLSVILTIVSCNSGNENNEPANITEAEITDETVQETDDTIISYTRDELIISGKDIWIRNKPITGDVVMKLNTGDLCKILETGEEDQIRDIFDYWYKIEFKDTVGWVFGAQTNVKSREIHDIVPFSNFLAEFIKAYNNINNDLSNYSHQEITKTFLYNPGAYCAEFYSGDLKRELPELINEENIFNSKPKGDVCEGYEGVKAGFYYWIIKSDELPTFPDMTDEEFKYKKINLQEKYTNNTIYKVQVITKEYHFSYLYFINIENTWFLICENRCDCSA